jgi:hypothetical protein
MPTTVLDSQRFKRQSRRKFALSLIYGLCICHRSDYEIGEPISKASEEGNWVLNESILSLVGAIQAIP